MKIKRYLSEHGGDFSALMVCEHCGHESKLTTGYHDHHYHGRVIPAMTCGSCGKNRAGEKPAESNVGGLVHVPRMEG